MPAIIVKWFPRGAYPPRVKAQVMCAGGAFVYEEKLEGTDDSAYFKAFGRLAAQLGWVHGRWSWSAIEDGYVFVPTNEGVCRVTRLGVMWPQGSGDPDFVAFSEDDLNKIRGSHKEQADAMRGMLERAAEASCKTT